MRPADCVMAGIIGAAGLRPTLAAVAQGRRVALANKECLVMAGRDLHEGGAPGRHRAGAGGLGALGRLPVDCRRRSRVHRAHRADGLGRAVPHLDAWRSWRTPRREQALLHPNWSMGRKITIDSATLMNKGLELIEAYHLFPVEPDQLEVVVHPQSIIHALVAYRDGSMLAQLASPDMRTPIALSLSWPGRMDAPTKRLDLVELGQLSFERPDERAFHGAWPGAPGHAAGRHGAGRAQRGQRGGGRGVPGGPARVPSNRPTCS